MLYRIKWFFKNRVARGSRLWNALLAFRRAIEKVQSLKSLLMRTLLPLHPIRNINDFESKIFSQNGEDGILQAIFQKIGTTNKFCVEFGVENGRECNTRYLREKRGWSALLMDPADNNPEWIKKEFITAQNINDLFNKYRVPKEFDLLSIDIDGNDYWVWKALDPGFHPRVVVMEYNAKFPPTESKTIVYDPSFRWDGSDYFGASLLALTKLAQMKGYRLVGCDRQGVNAFFVRHDLIQGHFIEQGIETLYRRPLYGKASDLGGWPAGSKTMVDV